MVTYMEQANHTKHEYKHERKNKYTNIFVYVHWGRVRRNKLVNSVCTLIQHVSLFEAILTC